MSDTLEFTIPDGYELDKENSTAKKAVCNKVEKYRPKEGDLVVTKHRNSSKHIISLYGLSNTVTPSWMSGLSVWVEGGKVYFCKDSIWNYDTIRPATIKERELFTRKLSKNGYEYDPVKKEVRKKRWRAEKRGVYFYIYDITQVCCVHDYHTIIDDGKYNSGNYFRTREEAEEVAAEFRAILNKRK